MDHSIVGTWDHLKSHGRGTHTVPTKKGTRPPQTIRRRIEWSSDGDSGVGTTKLRPFDFRSNGLVSQNVLVNPGSLADHFVASLRATRRSSAAFKRPGIV
jgi:hypothetical protein